MLEGFLVIVIVDDRLLRVLHILEVFVDDKLLPYGGDLEEKASCFLNGIFLLEQFSHVVITAA